MKKKPAENNLYDVHASHSVGTPHTLTVSKNNILEKNTALQIGIAQQLFCC